MDEISFELEIEDRIEEKDFFDCDTEEVIIEEIEIDQEFGNNSELNNEYDDYNLDVNNAEIDAISTEELEDIDCEQSIENDTLEQFETDDIIRDLLDQNVSEQRLLSDRKAEWSDSDNKGNSDCIIKDDAEFNVKYKSLQDQITYTGAEFKEHMKEKYGIDYVSYSHKEPDFAPFEQTFDKEKLEEFLSAKYGEAVTLDNIPEGHLTLECMGTDRADTYGKAYDYCIDVLGGKVTKKDLQEFMSENDLTWHECGDRKTIRLVPSEINQVFTHTGGIGIEKDFESLQAELLDLSGKNDGENRSMVLQRDVMEGETQGLEDAIEWRYEKNKERKSNLFGKQVV